MQDDILTRFLILYCTEMSLYFVTLQSFWQFLIQETFIKRKDVSVNKTEIDFCKEFIEFIKLSSNLIFWPNQQFYYKSKTYLNSKYVSFQKLSNNK